MSTAEVTATLARLGILVPTADAPADGLDPARVRALVDAARAGDREAFGDLVVLHERAVYRTALAALGSPADAEDAAQEAFVIAWRKLGSFRHEASFKTWLLTIVWRKALDRRRRLRVWWSRVAPASAEGGVDPVDRLEATGADPERRTVSDDLARRAQQQIQRLSPKLRDTLLLASSGECSYEQIAALLGVPVGTVKWRVSEARRVVAARLAGAPLESRSSR
ncbi:MAG TPA: RNA polymerase sigma factor [Vicinamibacterales bacterium]|nr:RNA polymerase sigma factor [Vicinamibacterales bacterium]